MRDRRFWLGLGASALFIALLLWRIDFRGTAAAFRDADYVLLVPAVGLYFVALGFRTWRWGVMLRPLKALGFGRLFPVMAVGYMANNLLPVRLGELVRSYYLGQREGVSKSASLATIVIERVLDGVVLLWLLAAVASALPLTSLAGALAQDTGIPLGFMAVVAVLPFALALAFLLLAAYKPAIPLALLRSITRPLPQALADKVHELAALFFSGLASLRGPRLLWLLLLTVPVWLGEAAMYYAVGVAFGLSGHLGGLAMMVWVMLAVTATSNLATALPSSQGGVGPFELFAAATLVVLGAPRELATAYAIVLHVTLLAPVTLLGLAYLWSGKHSFVQMARLGTRMNDQEPGGKDAPAASKEAS
ncbi:MAG: flippase-like domain-containing protein [Chloroflexi bacterium]|nr:flippase-like domain-containing protein [Chloroflexota bacterium]